MRIDDKYKWLARDEDGKLYAFTDKPKKDLETNEWYAEEGIWYQFKETDNDYPFVQWGNKEPWSKVNANFIANSKSFEKVNPQTDVVNKPSHYIGINGLEMEEVLENFLPKIEDSYVAHRLGSAVEYLLRSSEKNGIQDIKKAKRNLEQVIAYEKGKVKPAEPEPVRETTNDPLTNFLSTLRRIKVTEDKNMEKVSTFYRGYNLND